MDEWETWCFLAMIWDDNQNTILRNGGICLSLTRLVQCGEISCYKRLEMYDRLYKHCFVPEMQKYSHWWPLTSSGARERSKFCWMLAEECEKEES